MWLNRVQPKRGLLPDKIPEMAPSGYPACTGSLVEPQTIVDRLLQILRRSQVSLGDLDGCVAQQELNLLAVPHRSRGSACRRFSPYHWGWLIDESGVACRSCAHAAPLGPFPDILDDALAEITGPPINRPRPSRRRSP